MRAEIDRTTCYYTGSESNKTGNQSFEVTSDESAQRIEASAPVGHVNTAS